MTIQELREKRAKAWEAAKAFLDSRRNEKGTPAGQEVAGLSFGKMNTTIDIMEQRKVLDDDGFSSMEDVTVASVRAYREGRHGSERWANMAAFSEATDPYHQGHKGDRRPVRRVGESGQQAHEVREL